MYNKQVGVALEEGTQTLSPFYMTRCCGPRSADVLLDLISPSAGSSCCRCDAVQTPSEIRESLMPGTYGTYG